jgi:hypothetical protein
MPSAIVEIGAPDLRDSSSLGSIRGHQLLQKSLTVAMHYRHKSFYTRDATFELPLRWSGDAVGAGTALHAAHQPCQQSAWF